MKRRRITNERVESVVQMVLPNYKLIEAVRPDGEYINGSRFTFERTDGNMAFPNKIYLVDQSIEDGDMRFCLEYEKNEDRYIYRTHSFNIFQKLKQEIGRYSGYLDFNQTVDAITRYVNEVFTQSYIEKHRHALEGRIKSIAHAMHTSQDENGLIKAGTLYGRLNDETVWLPVRHVENHFAYTYPNYNPIDKNRDFVFIGGVYSVRLPLRDSSEIGGGVQRPCIILGKSSNDFYYVAPLCHIKHEDLIDPEYYVCNDKEGKPVYLTKGFVDCVARSNIYDNITKLNKNDLARIFELISRDNKIRPGLYDFSIGLGTATKDDLLKAQINDYDKNFKFPEMEELYTVIAKVFATEEKIAKASLYKKIANTYEFYVETEGEDIIFRFPRMDGKTKIIKFVIDQPIEVLSNHKSFVNKGVDAGKLSPDKMLSNAYRYHMMRKYPMFKYLFIKRIVIFYHNSYVKQKYNGQDTLEENVSYLKRQLDGCKLVYEGNLEELIIEGIDSIDPTKLHVASQDPPVTEKKPKIIDIDDENEL